MGERPVSGDVATGDRLEDVVDLAPREARLVERDTHRRYFSTVPAIAV